VRWEKRGLLIHPPTHLLWARSHAALPSAHLKADSLDVYFTTRDEYQRSHIARAEVDLAEPRVEVAPDPVLTPGSLGAFDDSGAMMSCVVPDGEALYLYYQGWSLGVTVPFYVYVGCAVSEGPGRPFVRVSNAPVLGRNPIDPYMCASPWVLREGDRWRMWYVSNVGWKAGATGSPHYVVNIKYAESADGIEWERDGHVCVDFTSPEEYALSRPCVVKDEGLYRMWYSYRGTAYRIGYAESPDGLEWERKDDEAGIGVSPDGWDSEMVEYPFVFDWDGARYMLYNGNDFGRDGAGLAVLREDQ
jgi:hypothetical protein